MPRSRGVMAMRCHGMPWDGMGCCGPLVHAVAVSESSEASAKTCQDQEMVSVRSMTPN